jgi:hypothetical protein
MEKAEEEAGFGLLHWVLSWFMRSSFFNTHPASGKRAKVSVSFQRDPFIQSLDRDAELTQMCFSQAIEDMVPMGLSIRAASPSCSEILAPQYDQFQSAFREYS